MYRKTYIRISRWTLENSQEERPYRHIGILRAEDCDFLEEIALKIVQKFRVEAWRISIRTNVWNVINTPNNYNLNQERLNRVTRAEFCV